MSRPDQRMPRTDQRLGRSHQRPGLLTAGQLTALAAIAGTLGLFVLWHLTLVLTAGVGVGDVGVTVRGLLAAAPLDLPARYHPAGPVPTLVVFGVLCAGALAGCVWWAVRHRTAAATPRARGGGRWGWPTGGRPGGRPGRSGPGTRPRSPAGPAWTPGCWTWTPHRWPRSGCSSGTTSDHREPVVLSLEDQVGVIAATGAGKTLYLMIGAALDAPGPLITTSHETRDPGRHRGIPHPPRPGVGVRPPGRRRLARTDDLEPRPRRPALRRRRRPGEGVRRRVRRRHHRQQQPVLPARRRRSSSPGCCTPPPSPTPPWSTSCPGRWSWNGPPPPGTSSTHHPDAELFWAKTLRAATEGADDTLSSVRMTLAQKVEPILSRTVMRQMLPTPGCGSSTPPGS